jgi:hypothetical protein
MAAVESYDITDDTIAYVNTRRGEVCVNEIGRDDVDVIWVVTNDEVWAGELYCEAVHWEVVRDLTITAE